MASACIKRYRKILDPKLLIQAKKYLKEENEILETPYNQAKRFNNLGLC